MNDSRERFFSGCFWIGHNVYNYDKKTRIGHCLDCGSRIRLNRDKSYPKWTIIDESEPDYGPTYEYSKTELRLFNKIPLLLEMILEGFFSYKTTNEKKYRKILSMITELGDRFSNSDLQNPKELKEITAEMETLCRILKVNKPD